MKPTETTPRPAPPFRRGFSLPEGTTPMNDQIDALKALQMALARLGYYTDAIDGLFGPRTDAALKALAAEGGTIAT